MTTLKNSSLRHRGGCFPERSEKARKVKTGNEIQILVWIDFPKFFSRPLASSEWIWARQGCLRGSHEAS